MDEATVRLLDELETSPTDLAKLVRTLWCRSLTTVAIPTEAIARWERDDLDHWLLVRDWLASLAVHIVVVPAGRGSVGTTTSLTSAAR